MRTRNRTEDSNAYQLIASKMNRHHHGGFSAIHAMGIAVVLGVLYLLIFAESDTERNHRIQQEAQSARMNELMRLVREYYSGDYVSAGTFGQWRVVAIQGGANNRFSKSINNIEIRLAVDTKAFQEIQQRTPDGRFRAASNGCPPRISPIYRIMTKNDFLTLQVEVNGAIFIDVDCMRWAGTVG